MYLHMCEKTIDTCKNYVCMCVYVCVYVCMYVYMYVCMYVGK